MIYKAEELANRLSQHAKDYKDGKVQDFAQVCKDCEVAANMIEALKKSKHTKKRATQRLRKKNREKNARIEMLTKELECIKERVEAKWERVSDWDSENNAYFDCSNCHHGDIHAEGQEVPYCWYCGAKMDSKYTKEES